MSGLAELERQYAQASQGVAVGRRIVAEQRQRIDRLRSQGHPVSSHERMLSLCVRTLRNLEQRERMVWQELVGARAQSTNRDSACSHPTPSGGLAFWQEWARK